MRDFCHVCGDWYVEVEEIKSIGKQVDCRCGARRLVYGESGYCVVKKYRGRGDWVRMNGVMVVDRGVEV